MSLEAWYQNTDVVLTKRLTRGQKNGVRYIKCLAAILITLYLVTVSLGLFLLFAILTVAAALILMEWVRARPRILLNTESRTVQINNTFFFWRRKTFHVQQIQRIAVALKTDPGGRYYRPQLFLKNPKKPTRPETVDCFDLRDIVESHYAAQLMATFAKVRAYDIKGNVLPQLKSIIPNKFLPGGKSEAVRPVPVRLAKKKPTTGAPA
ncbi:hypothetical protein [Nitrospina watsonii]|uniref:Uncharacterized protein n=1 Tax=Nitrospina watsonii TaxID=1323948 RepID=A0ABM9H9V1_9BACT|nr:hypothetical protein [Nitrospina watsonii]CAI2716903.1 conserved protein of unknown function [Nitrospina watsonii]